MEFRDKCVNVGIIKSVKSIAKIGMYPTFIASLSACGENDYANSGDEKIDSAPLLTKIKETEAKLNLTQEQLSTVHKGVRDTQSQLKINNSELFGKTIDTKIPEIVSLVQSRLLESNKKEAEEAIKTLQLAIDNLCIDTLRKDIESVEQKFKSSETIMTEMIVKIKEVENNKKQKGVEQSDNSELINRINSLEQSQKKHIEEDVKLENELQNMVKEVSQLKSANQTLIQVIKDIKEADYTDDLNEDLEDVKKSLNTIQESLNELTNKVNTSTSTFADRCRIDLVENCFVKLPYIGKNEDLKKQLNAFLEKSIGNNFKQKILDPRFECDYKMLIYTFEDSTSNDLKEPLYIFGTNNKSNRNIYKIKSLDLANNKYFEQTTKDIENSRFDLIFTAGEELICKDGKFEWKSVAVNGQDNRIKVEKKNKIR